MNADAIRLLHDYNRWAHHEVWRCIESLSDEQFTAETGYSIGSLRNHAVHVMGVDQRWFARLRQIEIPARLEYADFSTRAQARQRWDEIERENAGYLATLTDADLHEMIEYDMPHRGGWKRQPRWQILLHVVNHGSDHRAQMLAQLHRLGGPTVEQDLMFYLWQQPESAGGQPG